MSTAIEFDNVDELWLDALRRIIEDGEDVPSRDGPSREICGYTARLTNPFAHFIFNPVRKMAPHYAAAELLWYLSGERTISRILPYAPSYTRFVSGARDDGETAYGAYGPKIADRYTAVIDMLRKNPSSRQATIILWGEDTLEQALLGGRGDIPCTVALLFLARNGRLHLSAHMRSNDIWLGFPYDVFGFCALQILIAQSLGLEPGWYQHSAMSLHLYDRNKDKAQEAAYPPSFDSGPVEYPVPLSGYLKDYIQRALELEAHNRKIKCCANTVDSMENTLLGQMVVWASMRWGGWKNGLKRIATPLMRKHFERHFAEKYDHALLETTEC